MEKPKVVKQFYVHAVVEGVGDTHTLLMEAVDEGEAMWAVASQGDLTPIWASEKTD